MNQKLQILFFAICLTNGLTLMPQAPAMPQALLATITTLSTTFQNDDISSLKLFINNNPNFQWSEIYSHLPWPLEAQTPLSAATWFGAQKCVKYLLTNNIGQIKNSLNIPSSRGFTALHYAQNPPKTSSYTHQTTKNYSKIVTLLQKNGAIQ